MGSLEKLKKYFDNLLKEVREVKKDNIKDFIINRYMIIASFILVLFLIGGYSVGRINASKSNVITKLEVSLKEGKTNKLASIVRINGKKVKSNSLKPLIKYYEDSTAKVDRLVKDIKENGSGENLKIVEEDKLFGKSYYLELNTYNFKIESNFDDGVFNLNGKDKINAGSTFRGIIPGLYNIKGNLQTEYGEVKSEKELLIMKDEVISIDFDAINITLNSKYTDAKVYINDIDSNLTVEEIKEFGPFPTDESVSIYIEKKFPWGKVSSEKIRVTDTPNIIALLDMRTDALWEDIDEKVNLFYKSVFEALNKEDKEKITNSTVEAKNKIFDVLEKKYFIFSNKYDIKDMDIVKEQSEFTYNDGVYRGSVVVQVNYDVSKKFLGLSKTSNTKMFFTKMLYKDDNWSVEDVENFNL